MFSLAEELLGMMKDMNGIVCLEHCCQKNLQ